MFTLAGIQTDVTLGDATVNLERMEHWHAQRDGADLTVFPELSLTGYCFDSREAGVAHAEPIPGPATERLVRVCAQTGGAILFGLLEREGDRLHNALALVSGDGVLARYRKIHLPFIGVDRFVDPGDRPFEVIDYRGVRIGLNICYDCAFPESSRALALAGADLILLPTNWPPGAERMAEHVIATRALENGVYYAAIDRVGLETDVRFIGRSSVCDPTGAAIDTADATEEKVLRATIDPERARNKLVIRRTDVHMIDRFADRRPEMYGSVIEPHDLMPPGRSGIVDGGSSRRR